MATERGLLDALHTRLGHHLNGTTPRYVLAEHVRYDPGAGARTRVADAIAVDCWQSGEYGLTGYEVKTTRADWLRELQDPSKAETWAQHCREWWLITIPGVVQDDLPPGWGLLILRPDGKLARKVQAPPRLNWVPLPPGPTAGLARAVWWTAQRADGTPPSPETYEAPTAAPVAAPTLLPSQRAPGLLYDARTCPLWDCTQTAVHTHPHR